MQEGRGTNTVQSTPPLLEPRPAYIDNSALPLLCLPRELRSLIWEFAYTFSVKERLQISQEYPNRRDDFGLMLTCKQIHQEVGDLHCLSTVVIPAGLSYTSYGGQEAWELYMLNLSDSIPTALRDLAMAFSLLEPDTANPLDNLIHSNVLPTTSIHPA